MQVIGVLSTTNKTYKLQATSHEPPASFLPPPAGEVAAGRRGVVEQEVGSGMWEVVWASELRVVRGVQYVVVSLNRERYAR